MNDNTSMSQEDSLVGKLLIATPGMSDPRFDKAVILICAHDDQGCMGLVINQEMPEVEFEFLLDQLGIESDIMIGFDPANDVRVMSGGPVETARGFLLHGNDFSRQETVSVDGNFSITGTVDALQDVAKGEGPEDLLFVLGYAGWSSGQLEQELAQNAWLVTDAMPELVFAQDHGSKWTQAVRTLGVDPSFLTAQAGRA